MNKKLMTTPTNSGVLKCISMLHDDQISITIGIIQVDYYNRFQWIEVEAWYHSQIIGNMVKMMQENMLTKPITHN